jgi:NitT/TauT family transport system substrate-binding protein
MTLRAALGSALVPGLLVLGLLAACSKAPEPEAPGASAADATALQPFSYTTNWFAQAEHGGFYQAQASGLYRQAGLAVTLRMGGPQVNIMQLLAAGQTDCIMGYDVHTFSAWEQGIEAVTVAAAFQKDAAVLIAHPGVVQTLDDLRGKTLLLSSASMTSFWPWLKARHGLDDAQVRPYTFNIQPFVADRNVVQQGYLSSEPWAIEREAGIQPKVFLLADHGWPAYATTIVCLERTVRERPEAVGAFVRASMQGWKDYLQGDAEATRAADALIQQDNPNMTAEMIAHGKRMMIETGMVFGGDAATQGIGIVTAERMQQTYDMLVEMGLLDGSRVDPARTYTTRFVADLRILP